MEGDNSEFTAHCKSILDTGELVSYVTRIFRVWWFIISSEHGMVKIHCNHFESQCLKCVCVCVTQYVL